VGWLWERGDKRERHMEGKQNKGRKCMKKSEKAV
jgi:hypothetical protein